MTGWPRCGTWPYPTSDMDLVTPEDNAHVHRARGCCLAAGLLAAPQVTQTTDDDGITTTRVEPASGTVFGA